MDEKFWDDKYGENGQVWSGRPNGVLVSEAADLQPGRALDVGCGEGGDAHWLAEHGWTVTGVDLSRVALARARELCRDLPVDLRHQDIAKEPPEPGAYDLVSLHYFPLLREKGHPALRGLVEAVAPGGTLLVAGHEMSGLQAQGAGDSDQGDFYQPSEFAAFLGEGWTVEADGVRPRVDSAPEGTEHTHDVVLRAHRSA
ncbi:class I SAM-dependent methyltransferase [Nocardiopsis salina]|uniref:class I SAM-dependent methyltransferase n=1 Tax=Nocardiopsis salina TaxID=245836 RepID=UPI00034647F7|nr:class I SAM-dependent methyltransferase [Nocardiopsis salina]